MTTSQAVKAVTCNTLVKMGFKKSEAEWMIDRALAMSHAGPMSLEELVKSALRAMPLPGSSAIIGTPRRTR